MLSKKNILKTSLIITTFIGLSCLVSSCHKYKVIKQKHQMIINEEFEKDLKIKQFDYFINFVKPMYDKRNKEKLEIILKEEKLKKDKERQKEEKKYINLICSFYTGSEDENGDGNAGITASGKRLSRGICASNAHKIGTKIHTTRFGSLVVEDRGNPNYIHQVDENTYKIDIYVPTKEEANRLGVIKTKGYIK